MVNEKVGQLWRRFLNQQEETCEKGNCQSFKKKSRSRQLNWGIDRLIKELGKKGVVKIKIISRTYVKIIRNLSWTLDPRKNINWRTGVVKTPKISFVNSRKVFKRTSEIFIDRRKTGKLGIGNLMHLWTL